MSDIIQKAFRLDTELTITTNAVLVHKFIDVFSKANIPLNVSPGYIGSRTVLFLPERSIQTNIGQYSHAHRRGFHVKINMVVMKRL